MEAPQLYDPPQRSAINIGQEERTFSLIGGIGLITFALWRRSAISIPMLLTGFGLIYRGMTGNSSLYGALDRNTAVKSNPANVSVPHQQGVHVERAVTVNRPVEDLYNFWHDPVNLPQVMGYVDSIQPISNNQTHWTVKLPGGAKVEFDSEVYTDTPN